MTAKSLEENPASHAKASTTKIIKLLEPEGLKRRDLVKELVVVLMLTWTHHSYFSETRKNR